MSIFLGREFTSFVFILKGAAAHTEPPPKGTLGARRTHVEIQNSAKGNEEKL